MIQVECRKAAVEDIPALARIAWSVREGTVFEPDKNVEEIAANIEKISTDDSYRMLIAQDENRTILGWMYYYVRLTPMAFINGFQPIVESTLETDETAMSLIEAAKRDISDQGYNRLEIELKLKTDAHRRLSERFFEWYGNCGFRFAAEEVHMSSNLASAVCPDVDLPKQYILRKFSEVPYEKLERAGLQTFENSADALFLSISPAEREVTLRYFFDTSTPFIEDASLVLEHDGEVVGFIITRTRRGEVEIGPVGLIPEVRGQGLAGYLLARVLAALKENDTKDAVLDMSIHNHPARKLYEKYGFKDEYCKQFYFWVSHTTF